MEANSELLTKVLTNARTRTRFSKTGFACICLFELVHGMGLFGLNDAVSVSGEWFGLTDEQMRILFVVHFANSYVTPILGALFADLVVGKYRAVFFSAGMRAFAAVVIMVIAIVFQIHDKMTMNPALKSFLFGIYLFSLMFIFISIEFTSPIMIPFGMQQVDQENSAALTSAARWLMWSYDVGVVISALGLGALREWFFKHHIMFESAEAVVMACLMISIFILGKGQYNRNSTTEGRSSFSVVWHVIKTKFCCRYRHHDLDEPMTFENEEIGPRMKRLNMERLVLRKLVLMLGLFAAIGLSQVVYYKMLFIKVTGWCDPCHRRVALTLGYHTMFAYVPFIIIVPIWELISWRRRRARYLLVQSDHTSFSFKVMGFGLFLGAAAALSAGALFAQNKHDWKSLWLLVPSYLALGLMSLLTYIKAIEFCYKESFKGLECFTTSLLTSLWMLLYSTITWTEVDWSHDWHSVGLFLYALSGALVGTTLVVFIPVSIWYNRVKQEIAGATSCLPRSRSYSTLTGTTILSRQFLSNEETGERVQVRSPHGTDETL